MSSEVRRSLNPHSLPLANVYARHINLAYIHIDESDILRDDRDVFTARSKLLEISLHSVSTQTVGWVRSRNYSFPASDLTPSLMPWPVFLPSGDIIISASAFLEFVSHLFKKESKHMILREGCVGCRRRLHLKRYKWQDNLTFLLIVLFQTKEWFISQLQPEEMNTWVGLPENRTSTLANSWLFAGCHRVPWSCSSVPIFSGRLHHGDRIGTKKWSRIAIWLSSGVIRTWRI